MSDGLIFNLMERRRGRIQQHADNSSRPGRVLSTYTATGQGAHYETQCFNFGSSFETKPFFTFGSEFANEPPSMPVCVASVYNWRRTANGFYTGAYVAFYVGSLTSDVPSYDVEFHLCWEGTLNKDVIGSLGFPAQSLEI